MIPNPSKGKVTLKPNRVNDNTVTVEVFNLVGTRLLNTQLSELKDLELQLNLSHLPSQVYYIKVTTKGESKIKKLVIDR